MDIKPANILIDHGRAMLADCGLAMEMVKVKRAGSDTQTMMGNWGQCVGTPFFIDPQYQYVSSSRAGEYHRYSDVYSMGVTLLLVLTGLDVRFKVGTKGSGKSENKNTVVWCHENYDTILTAGEGDTMTINRELGPHHPVDFVKTNVNDRNCSTYVKRSIADPVAGWPADKAAAVFKLGMDMIEYSPYKRPSVEQCEERLSSVLY
jgi:serine/threonine protein kinase